MKIINAIKIHKKKRLLFKKIKIILEPGFYCWKGNSIKKITGCSLSFFLFSNKLITFTNPIFNFGVIQKVMVRGNKVNLFSEKFVASIFISETDLNSYIAKYKRTPYNKCSLVFCDIKNNLVVFERLHQSSYFENDFCTYLANEMIHNTTITKNVLNNSLLKELKLKNYISTFQHGDMHSGNIFYDDGAYKLIDFDCANSYPFCYDYVMHIGLDLINMNGQLLKAIFSAFNVPISKQNFEKYIRLCFISRFLIGRDKLSAAYEYIDFKNNIVPYCPVDLKREINYLDHFLCDEINKIQ